MESISPEFALDVLKQDADRIKRLIRDQKNSLCISQCKAFEEVVDTQMYGLSRQVAYAIRLGIVSKEAGHQLLSDVERDLNILYSEVYEKQAKNSESGKEV
ncbi:MULTISPECIES: YlaN family protein [Enterococcus]|uniref:YlaN family protein n=1 Tax=Enterococcus TaxID=1350 RepID=UPI00065E4219|nr:MULTISPECIES: YlaN family protein [Enterococcus]KAF1304719.1 hypothetical protein BAU16_00675 [Enterococcus sp. JM9B]